MVEPERIYVLIMAGGKGLRFWPLSRESRPKQLLPITGAGPMIRMTVERMLPLVPAEQILVVTGDSHLEEVQTLLPELPPDNIVPEPVGRNTAACIGLGAELILKRHPGGIMVVLPADHVIARPEAFRRLVAAGVVAASRQEVLVTLGIRPTRPETGYGYIEAAQSGQEIEGQPVLPVLHFHEKPAPETARRYLAGGRHYWNSGIFIWQARVIRKWIDRLLPDLARGLERLAPACGRPDFGRCLAEHYPSLASISIDHGVLERAEDVVVLPADMDWEDVGSWSAAGRFWPQEEENAVMGHVLPLDSTGCVVHSPTKLVALLGVNDLVVVDTPDVLLICPKHLDQEIRRLVEKLREQGRLDLL
jgi:mannose-1-phosphate guanylyltransferase